MALAFVTTYVTHICSKIIANIFVTTETDDIVSLLVSAILRHERLYRKVYQFYCLQCFVLTYSSHISLQHKCTIRGCHTQLSFTRLLCNYFCCSALIYVNDVKSLTKQPVF